MLAVAQDVRGEETVRPIVEERGVTFPVLLDRASVLAARLGFQVVPSGFFVEPDGTVTYRHVDDFDIGDPRVRRNLDAFLGGGGVEAPGPGNATDPRALELFADGAGAYAAGDEAAGRALAYGARARPGQLPDPLADLGGRAPGALLPGRGSRLAGAPAPRGGL